MTDSIQNTIALIVIFILFRLCWEFAGWLISLTPLS